MYFRMLPRVSLVLFVRWQEAQKQVKIKCSKF